MHLTLMHFLNACHSLLFRMLVHETSLTEMIPKRGTQVSRSYNRCFKKLQPVGTKNRADLLPPWLLRGVPGEWGEEGRRSCKMGAMPNSELVFHVVVLDGRRREHGVRLSTPEK